MRRNWTGCAATGLALLALAGLIRAHAASFNCQAALQPVTATICADPRLSRLDSRLAAAYALARARNPAQRAALAEDERNWLAARDDRGWQWLADPALGADAARRRLATLYRHRIEFLQSVGNPIEIQGSPIMQTFMDNALELPVASGDVLQQFARVGLVTIAPRRRFGDLAALVAALPAPPDTTLRAALHEHPGADRFVLVYFETRRIGAVFATRPDGCTWLVPFQREGGATGDVWFPRAEWWGCQATRGRFALVGDRPVVISQRRGAGWTDLRWWRWAGGDSGPLARIRVRFAPALEPGAAACATPLPCQDLRAAALRTVQRYAERPVPATLAADTASLSAAGRAQFEAMEAAASRALRQQRRRVQAAWATGTGSDPLLRRENAGHHVQRAEQRVVAGLPGFGTADAPDIPGWFGPSAAFFPARVDGRLLLGRIGHPQLGWRTRESVWMVGYWTWNGRTLAPAAGFVVNREDGRPLVAARMPTPGTHR